MQARGLRLRQEWSPGACRTEVHIPSIPKQLCTCVVFAKFGVTRSGWPDRSSSKSSLAAFCRTGAKRAVRCSSPSPWPGARFSLPMVRQNRGGGPIWPRNASTASAIFYEHHNCREEKECEHACRDEATQHTNSERYQEQELVASFVKQG